MTITTLQSKIFGPLTYSFDKGFYEDVNFQDGTGQSVISVMLFEGFSPEQLAEIEPVLDKFPAYSDAARKYLLDELAQDNQTIQYFLDFHREELGEDLADFYGISHIDKISSQEMVKRVILKGLHIWANQENEVGIVFDYVLNSELSDEILAVKFDLNGKIKGVDHES